MTACPPRYAVPSTSTAASPRMDTIIEQLIPARRRDLGGFEVGRLLPAGRRRMVGPFIFFDHIGPAALTPPLPRAMDVRPHPHIGLATVTYLFDGEMTHRDSLGCEQVIRPAEVNWMTAGRGISHSERFDGMRERGGALHGIQAWVALPAEAEETDPAFEHYGREELPTLEGHGLAGAPHRRRTARGPQRRPDAFAAALRAHRTCRGRALPRARRGHRTRALRRAGSGRGRRPALHGGPDARARRRRDAGRRSPRARHADAAGRRARRTALHLVELRLVAPRTIEQAKADWQGGRIALPVGDADEWIAAPDDPMPDAAPASIEENRGLTPIFVISDVRAAARLPRSGRPPGRRARRWRRRCARCRRAGGRAAAGRW